MKAEIWARPGAATFERIWEDPQAIRISGTARMSGTGDGEMQLPDIEATVEFAIRSAFLDTKELTLADIGYLARTGAMERFTAAALRAVKERCTAWAFEALAREGASDG